MKYAVILGDGMSDRPIKKLNGKTPLAVAKKPAMDALAARGMMGLAQICPDGIKCGSDTANMAILGYHPGEHYTGRGPLEAASLGVELSPDEVAFRMNLISLEGDPAAPLEEQILKDYSSGHITTDEAAEIVAGLAESFVGEPVSLYAGKQYRHLLVTKGNAAEYETIRCAAPHDHMDEGLKELLPQGPGADSLYRLMERSRKMLPLHPVNQRRKAQGKRTADLIWPWGQGRAPRLAKITERYGISGAMISAVDLLQGLGRLAGLDVLMVEGATGYHDTNYEGKAAAAIATLKQKDFVFVHLESTDEAGHEGDAEEKIRGIERLDERIVRPIWDHLRSSGEDYKILILPDHATPAELRIHVDDPVPFVLYSSECEKENGNRNYCEEEARSTGTFVQEGWHLMDLMISGLSG